MTPLLLAAAILVALTIGGAVGFITAGFLAWSKCRDEHYTLEQVQVGGDAWDRQLRRILDQDAA